MKKQPEPQCLKCGKPIPGLLHGATCNTCINRERKNLEYAANQRLAGQLPPKGSSV